MRLRHVLIIISSAIIILLIIIISSISYKMGVNYGEQNAEEIRENKTQDSTVYETNTKIVNVIQSKNIYNSEIIKSSGRVSSLQTITISAEVQGKIKGEYSFKKGSKFKKGQVLCRIESTDFSLLIEARKSRFLNIISSILADIKLDFPSEYKKWENFFNNIKIDQNIPDLPDIKDPKEKNFIVSRSILSEHLSIKSDEERLKKYTIRSPFSGSVTQSYAEIGSTINPGSPIMNIIRNDIMEIEIPINKADINKISIGDIVSLYDDNIEISTKIIRKGDFVDPSTQNVSVFAEIYSSNNILSGMYLNANISSQDKIKTVNIPRRSVFGEDYIYVVEENKLIKQKVNIYSSYKNTVNVTGLSDGMLIVAEPIINAKEGMKVESIIAK